MADAEVANEGSLNQCENASGDDVKDSNTTECRKESSEDAELDDILEGSLQEFKITSRVDCWAYVHLCDEQMTELIYKHFIKNLTAYIIHSNTCRHDLCVSKSPVNVH